MLWMWLAVAVVTVAVYAVLIPWLVRDRRRHKEDAWLNREC
jgi:hypothetical protein